MKFMKRALTMLLVVTMLLGVFAMSASAQESVSTVAMRFYLDGVKFAELPEEELPVGMTNGLKDWLKERMETLYAPMGYTFQDDVWYWVSNNAEVDNDDKTVDSTGAPKVCKVYINIVPEIPGTYTIKFDKNSPDAIGHMDPQVAAVGEATMLKPETFTLQYHTFEGWNTKANGTGVSYANCAVVTDLTTSGGEVTLYAQWKKSESIPVAPIKPMIPAPFVGAKINNAVKVSCGKEYHDDLSYPYYVNKNSQMNVVYGTDGKIYCYITLSNDEVSSYVAKYNADTNGKHGATNRNFPEITLVWNPIFWFWQLNDDANITTTCDPSGCCGWWHSHEITYTDGVAKEVIFKDVVKVVRHGAATPTIKDPVRAGYKFAGWAPEVSAKATACVTYVAQWVPDNTPSLTTEHVAYLKGYGKGYVKPEGNITRAEAATMLYRLMDSASSKKFYTPYNSFSDVNTGDWYNDAVSTLANAGVLRTTSGLFNPNEAITRAEFFYMLTGFSDVIYNGKCYFNDVPANHWAYEELALAQYLGWIKGYGGSTLHPDDTITRAEVAATLNRVLDREDCNVKDTKNYVDNPVNAWYYQDIVEASIAH